MIINKLSIPPGQTGNAADLLRLPRGPDGFLDISKDDWSKAEEIIHDVEFDRVRLVDVQVEVTFTRCKFRECEFRQLRSNDSLWGNTCQWERCSFDAVTLSNPLSPMNVFRECRFHGVSLTAYLAYQTLFQGCTFIDLSVEGLRVNTVKNSVNFLPELQAKTSSLMFEACRFVRPQFSKCYFNGVGFARCQIEEPQVIACDFSGADADAPWWQPQDQGDPYFAVLSELVPAVERAMGVDHPSANALRAYAKRYRENPSIGKDFSSYVFSKEAVRSSAELRRLSSAIDRVMERFED